ncbi:MAG: GNAT family N-acetyltransferase [Desulfuromonadales bacterium]
MQSIEIVTKYVERELADILMLEKECFPADWQYPEAAEYYASMLADSENVNIFLRDGGETVGYLLARPFKSVVQELKESDPELTDKLEAFYYIETIQILPSYQGKGGARRLLIETSEAVMKHGVNKFAIHARTTNGLNQIIKKVFAGFITLTREIDSWRWANGEPYEYIEWESNASAINTDSIK